MRDSQLGHAKQNKLRTTRYPETFLPWQLLTDANQLEDAPVVTIGPANFATFFLELEAQLVVFDVHMPVLEDAAVLMFLQIRLSGTPEDKLRKSVARAT